MNTKISVEYKRQMAAEPNEDVYVDHKWWHGQNQPLRVQGPFGSLMLNADGTHTYEILIFPPNQRILARITAKREDACIEVVRWPFPAVSLKTVHGEASFSLSEYQTNYLMGTIQERLIDEDEVGAPTEYTDPRDPATTYTCTRYVYSTPQVSKAPE